MVDVLGRAVSSSPPACLPHDSVNTTEAGTETLPYPVAVLTRCQELKQTTESEKLFLYKILRGYTQDGEKIHRRVYIVQKDH
jgi:hypothetical protein